MNTLLNIGNIFELPIISISMFSEIKKGFLNEKKRSMFSLKVIFISMNNIIEYCSLFHSRSYTPVTFGEQYSSHITESWNSCELPMISIKKVFSMRGK